ncbi:RagB/SusD family nutrient uptake outer membrane protein [Parabacteroides sp. OttesenSCG-928-G06]|nr:RagB/SusD family nutrient uptake outer membrane protein [Parabacteroides sp. OttesenSCG-928-G06]
MKNKIKSFALIALSLGIFSSCSEDYFETLPTSSTPKETIFQDTKSATMAVNGMARLMVSQYGGFGQTFCGEGTIKFLYGEYLGEHFSRPALASGWQTVMNATFLDNVSYSYLRYPWYYYYMIIGNANNLIAYIDGAEGTEAERQYLKAQALTYRAYCYTQLVQFYCYRWADSQNGSSLTNYFDGLILRTEENMDEKDMPLSSSGEIYKLIYKDLDEAISLFTASGLKRKNVWEPNVNVAHAVYARAAVTRQDYATAATNAAAARKGFALMTNKDYVAGFSKPNSEWIWGSYGGDDQSLFYYGFHSHMAYDANTSIVRSYPVCISKTLYDKIPATDVRRDLFLDPKDSTYNNSTGVVSATFATEVRKKYPTMTSGHNVAAYQSFKFGINGSRGVGYINHFRTAEMILIEAEANYFSGDETAAIALLHELVRDSKRDEAYTCTATGEELLKEIKFYRAVELWGEGFDWFDKKRYNEPIVRVALKDGGSFGTAAAGTREIDYKNRWTYMTPLIESESNGELQ